MVIWNDGMLTCVGFIELKSALGAMSETQRDFRARATSNLCHHAVCRDLDEFIAVLDRWKVPLRNRPRIIA
jgi:hypothetical protein